jgi:uroporphyrinogen decarboxylase
MHPRVDSLPRPTPDYRRFLQVLHRERPERVPLIELAVHGDVVSALLDEAVPLPLDGRVAAERAVRLQHRLGYDVVKISAPIPFNIARLAGHDPAPRSNAPAWATPNTDDASLPTVAGRNVSPTPAPPDWTNEHRGPIASLADCETFRWPAKSDVDFGPVDAATRVLPDGMKLLGFWGGVLEFAMDLLGMQPFMVATRRDPALVAAVIERVGRILYGVFEAYCQLDSVCALWLGDDLGHKHGTLLSPKWLTEHVVPWYRRFADLAHAHGRPFLLHTCGDTAAVMPAMVAAGIDAKHSFEDVIEPVEPFYDRWSGQIAVLGGVDVDLLATGTPDLIRRRTRDIVEHCAPQGGYAAGSGNSIPNYVPAENYLALIEAVGQFNGTPRL